MVEKVNFSVAANNVQFKAKTAKVTNPQADNTVANVKKDAMYVDNAEAVAKYVTHPVNIVTPVAVEDYKKMLTEAGLIEGKNFEVQKFGDSGHVMMYIYSKDDPNRIIKRMYWKGGEGAANYDGCTETMYPDNAEFVSVDMHRDPQGRIREQTTTYANPDKHKDLFPKNIDINTTADDYKKILDSQNVRYAVFADKEVPDMTVFLEYGPDGKTVVKETCFYDTPDCKDVDQYIKNEKGDFVRATHIIKAPKEGVYRMSVTLSMDEILRLLQSQNKVK